MIENCPTYEVTADLSRKVLTGSFLCACGERHSHGLTTPRGVPEHRGAHCSDREFHPRGYWIVWR